MASRVGFRVVELDDRAPAAGVARQCVQYLGELIVGLELKFRGLDVEPALYCDETAFDGFAETIATVAGTGDGGGQVCVTDEGGLTWTCDYWADRRRGSRVGTVRPGRRLLRYRILLRLRHRPSPPELRQSR